MRSFIFSTLTLCVMLVIGCKEENNPLMPAKNNPPTVPNNPNPADSSSGLPIDIILNWQSNDPDGDSLVYDLYFSTDKDNMPILIQNLRLNTYKLSNLSENTKYFWKIVAKDKSGENKSGKIWSFSIGSTPTAPSNPKPIDGSFNQLISPTLTWKCTDRDSLTLTYDLYFGTSVEPTNLITSSTNLMSYKQTGLEGNTKYYWKVVVRNGQGFTSTSPTWSFTTHGLLTYNGFTYKTVTIGNQEWTVENLRTTTYNDGSPIDSFKVTIDSTNGTYCAYQNNEINVSKYGYLYNFYAIRQTRFSPNGWRVPTAGDWNILFTFIGGKNNAGTVLKTKSGWENNGNGLDSFGFSALPGGVLYFKSFNGIGSFGQWWSATTVQINRYTYPAVTFSLNSNNSSVSELLSDYNEGYSVRFVRDK